MAVGQPDPGRRDRIVDAALDVVAAEGVGGVSHRKVAAAAGVPLGSMTYHFDGMDDLLETAFRRFADGVADQFETRLRHAAGEREVVDAVVALVVDDTLASPRDLVLTQELYTLAARDPRFRTVTHAWMRRSRDALERHLDPATARILDALVEGLALHRALDTDPHDRAVAVDAVTRVVQGRVADRRPA